MIAIYARQSIDKKDSLSIDSQITKCIEYCKFKDWDEYEVYKDPGYSGKDFNRPDFKRLMADIKAGKIDYVVCYRLDRISRSIRDSINLIADLTELKTYFVSVTENIETSTSAGRMLSTFVAAMAQMEREGIIERVTDNYYYRCALGYWGGGPAPYGYRLKRITEGGKAHTVLEINEEEADVVRTFFHLYIQPGMSVFKILNYANQNGITTRKGSLWTSRVISDLLYKPLYAPNDMDMYNYFKERGAIMTSPPDDFDGTMAVNLYGKQDKNVSKHKRCRKISNMYFSIARHLPIVSSSEWIAVQQKKAIVLENPPRRGTGRASVFTGLLKCAHCGRAISTSGSRNNVKYYICSTKRNYGSGICPSHMIKQEVLDSVIFDDLLSHMHNEDISGNLDKYKHSSSSEFSIKTNTYKIELEKIETEIQNLLSAVADSGATAARYLNEKIEELDRRKSILNGKILKLEQKEYAKYARFSHINFDTLEYDIINGDFDKRKNIAHALIKKVNVYDNKDINVEYWI